MFIADEIGTSAIEYAFIAFLIATLLTAAFFLVRAQLSDLYASVSSAFDAIF